jgi:hypothetical protein
MFEDATGRPSLWTQVRTWLLRFYAGAFLAFALLAGAYATRHDQTWRIAFKASAVVVGALAIGCGITGYIYGVRARRAKRGSPWSSGATFGDGAHLADPDTSDRSFRSYLRAIRQQPAFVLKVSAGSLFFVGLAIRDGAETGGILVAVGIAIGIACYPVWRRRSESG